MYGVESHKSIDGIVHISLHNSAHTRELCTFIAHSEWYSTDTVQNHLGLTIYQKYPTKSIEINSIALTNDIISRRSSELI